MMKMKMEKTPEQSTIRENSHHCPHERQGIYENRKPDEVVLFAFLPIRKQYIGKMGIGIITGKNEQVMQPLTPFVFFPFFLTVSHYPCSVRRAVSHDAPRSVWQPPRL
jgi:hypothetical protein